MGRRGSPAPRWRFLNNRQLCLACAALSLWLGIAAPAQADGSVPAEIHIPKIGTHAIVVPLGQDTDGTMQAPDDPDTVGWFELGPALGAPGNILLDGHVDWGGRLRAFGLLRQLQPGDDVDLVGADGTVFSYTVSWVNLYDATTAPLDEIFESSSNEEITLITCGGVFDPSIHMYLSRWVVRAVRT